mgnify:CR=1 FL=1
MIQIILILAVFAAIIIPTGKYLYHIASYQRTFADAVFNKIDNAIYYVCGIEKKEKIGRAHV